MKAFSARRSPKGGPKLYLIMFAVAIVVAAIANSALGAPVKKLYEATIAPTYIAAGGTGTYRLTLTNDTASQQGLGSANFVVPSGFSAVGASLFSAPTGKNWSAAAAGNVVQFRSGSSKDGLAPGQSVVASVTLTAPGVTAACFDYSWANEIKQSNDFSGTGNDFTLSGATPVLTVAKLVFTTSPPTQIVSGATIAPPVVVASEDGCGTPLPNAPGSVTVAIGANPGGGVLSGTLTQALSGGTATFSDLSVGPAPFGVGSGYTLLATHSSPSYFSQGTSNPFDVLGKICTSATPQCHVDDPTLTTHLDAPIPTGDGALGIGFNNGFGPQSNCGTATTRIGSVAVVDPTNLTLYTVTVTYEKSVSGNGPASAFQVCLFKPGDVVLRAPMKLCSSKVAAPCIVSRKRTSSGALQIVLSLNADDPGIVTG